MKRSLTSCAGVSSFMAVLLVAALPARATTNVVVFQSGFESPVALTSPDAKIDPAGWTREHSYTGLFNENNTNLAARVNTPYGEQYASIWSATGIKTTNITDRLQPGVTYTLTFNVGNSGSGGSPAVVGNNYLAQILAGTNVVASTTGTTDSNDFSVDAVLTYTTDGTNSYLGQILGIRIAHDGPDWHYKTLIDNVKLVADESASEWTHTLHIGR